MIKKVKPGLVSLGNLLCFSLFSLFVRVVVQLIKLKGHSKIFMAVEEEEQE